MSQDRDKLLLLSHNFSNVMISSTSLNKVHYGNVACPVVLIPFQSHARVYCRHPVRRELVGFQYSIYEMVGVLLAHILTAKSSMTRVKEIGRVLCNQSPGCSILGIIQMVLEELALISWRVIPLVSNSTCFYEAQRRPNCQRLRR
jgi:hypothetical protein